MDSTIKLTILGLSGEVIAKREVHPGHTIRDLKEELARSQGFPVEVVKLINGEREPEDKHAFQPPVLDILLTCIFMAVPVTDSAFVQAARKGQHGHVRAMLGAAGAEQRRRLFLTLGVLHKVASYGRLATAEVLVRAAASDGVLEQCLMQVDHDGCTALHCAAAKGQSDQVRLLLSAAGEEGCLERLLLLSSRKERKTALQYAAFSGQLGVCEILVATAAEQAVLGQLLATKGAAGFTALHTAAFWGHSKILEMLLASADAEGGTLLDELLEARTSNDLTLMEIAADPDHGTGELLAIVMGVGRM